MSIEGLIYEISLALDLPHLPPGIVNRLLSKP